MRRVGTICWRLSEWRANHVDLSRTFVIVTTFYVHDFWNQSGGNERLENIVHVMKNISIIGALFMIIGYRPIPTVATEPIYHDRSGL